MLRVAEVAARYRFANPGAGRRCFIARADRDQLAGVNESINGFVEAALRCNLPMTLVNHASGPRGFDVIDDGEPSRVVVRGMIAFLRANLEA